MSLSFVKGRQVKVGAMDAASTRVDPQVGRGPAWLSLASQGALSCAVGPAVNAEFCHSASAGRTVGAQPLQQWLSLSGGASLRERPAGVLVSNSASQRWPSNWGIMNAGRHPRLAKMPSSFPTAGVGGTSLWPLPGFNWQVTDAPQFLLPFGRPHSHHWRGPFGFIINPAVVSLFPGGLWASTDSHHDPPLLVSPQPPTSHAPKRGVGTPHGTRNPI